jgi:hypothetical protein
VQLDRERRLIYLSGAKDKRKDKKEGRREEGRKEGRKEEINRSIQLGWMAYGKMRDIFKGNILLSVKRKACDQCILPVLSYGRETWSMTREMGQKLGVTQKNGKKHPRNTAQGAKDR